MNSRVRNLQEDGPFSAAPRLSHSHSPLAALVATLLGRDPADLARRAELESLLRESDPALQAEALLSLAAREEIRGEAAFAAEMYAAIAAGPYPQPCRERAADRMAVLQGRGTTGDRLEHLGRHFSRQAADPAMLGAMFLGSLAFQGARFAALSRLTASPSASLFTRGLGARGLAWSAGFALEVPTFTFGARGLHALLGRELDWSAPAIRRDLLSAGLTLFFLKGSGGAASSLMRRFAANGGTANAVTRFSIAALPQAAAFTGILGVHALEARLGLRPRTDLGSAVVESLATLLQFHVAGRLLRGAGLSPEPRLEALNRRLEAANRPSPPLPSLAEAISPRPALAGGLEPAKPFILMMSGKESKATERPIGWNPPEAKGIQPSRIPIHANPELFKAIRDQFSRLEFEMGYAYNEQSGEGMWAEQGHRIALELLDHLQLMDRHLPHAADRSILNGIRGELRWVRRMLDDLRQAKDLPASTSPEVRKFIGALYRVPNKAVNYINNGVPRDLQGSLFNASDARLRLFRDVFRFRRVNADAETHHLSEPEPLRSRLNVDSANPSLRLQVPHYEYRDEFESPYLEIPGEGRKVVLIGEVPRERVALARRHALEIVASDSENYARFAGEAVRHDRLDQVRVIWRDWKMRTRDAEYLEGYDLATARQLSGSAGERLMEDLVFDRLRPGGVALLVSRDAAALQRMVQIATSREWADVIMGSYHGYLPVEVSRPDQESGNFVFLRKLAQL
ncbi:MAG: hypothetical protein IT572_08895 [Deltaproteobacteria bacterium]|nr:hypothetical protein [Deltaproteobacteria bacterium]